MHRDTVIGIVGVVILVAAMIGVFTYERGQAAVDGSGAGAATQNLTGPSADGTVAVGSTTDSEVTINQTGLTNITFTLTWTPGANSVDTLKITAAPSAGTGMTTAFESDPENDGEIELVIPVNNTAADGVLGMGAWQLTVEFISSTGPGGVDPPPPVPVGDANVNFAIATALEAFATGDAA